MKMELIDLRRNDPMVKGIAQAEARAKRDRGAWDIESDLTDLRSRLFRRIERDAGLHKRALTAVAIQMKRAITLNMNKALRDSKA